jgi:Glycosyl transferase family 2
MVRVRDEPPPAVESREGIAIVTAPEAHWPACGVGVSVGIFAYNEQATIRQVVESFLAQAESSTVVREIIVVCCACTDQTVPIVRAIAQRHPRVRLLVRPRREGKVAAINEFIALAGTEVLVLSSGDVVAASDAVDLLAAPVAADDLCMMTGPRVLPAAKVGRPRLVDHLHAVLWLLHHEVSVSGPKLGEVVAIQRHVVQNGLPLGIDCDEALMESLVDECGGTLRYVSEASVYNFAPSKVGDLYHQRRRIAAQHLALKRKRGYSPSTTAPTLVVRALRMIPANQRRHLAVLAALEVVAKIHGRWDVRRGRTHRIWRVAHPESRADHHTPVTGRGADLASVDHEPLDACDRVGRPDV